MAKEHITQLRKAWQVAHQTEFIPQEWERFWFQNACAWAREKARQTLEAWDEWLWRHKPPEWRVVGKRRRTLVTRFGDVTFQRRLYQDETGAYCFLLDEFIDLPAYQVATADIIETVILLTRTVSLEQTAKLIATLTAGALSVSTIWRLSRARGEASRAGRRANPASAKGARPQARGNG